MVLWYFTDILLSTIFLSIIIYVAWLFKDWKKEYVSEQENIIRDVLPCDCGCYSEEDEEGN